MCQQHPAVTVIAPIQSDSDMPHVLKLCARGDNHFSAEAGRVIETGNRRHRPRLQIRRQRRVCAGGDKMVSHTYQSLS
jgi:hypothetical protein